MASRLTYRLTSGPGGEVLHLEGDVDRGVARELADVLPVSRPAVSQHLKVLKRSGLVTDLAEGTRRIYRVNPEAVAALRDYLDNMWGSALSAFAEAVKDRRDENPTNP